MAINTYSTLKTSVTSWLDINVADLSTVIDDLVTLGETRIFREARTKDTETAFSLAITGGVLTVPGNYVELKHAYVDSSPTQILERRSAEYIYGAYPTRSSSGKPKFIAREASNFIFGPYPDSGYTIKGVYYRRLVPLATAIHDLFVNNPDLYLFACLAESEIIIGRDNRVAVWEGKYQKILADVNGMDRKEQASGSGLRMRIA